MSSTSHMYCTAKSAQSLLINTFPSRFNRSKAGVPGHGTRVLKRALAKGKELTNFTVRHLSFLVSEGKPNIKVATAIIPLSDFLLIVLIMDSTVSCFAN